MANRVNINNKNKITAQQKSCEKASSSEVQGLDIDCDTFPKYQIIKGIYPAVLYVVPLADFVKKPGRLIDWSLEPITIPKIYIPKFSGYKKLALKIFLVTKQSVKILNKYELAENKKYDDLIDDIETIREKNIHKKITENNDEARKLEDFLTNLEDQKYIHPIRKSLISKSMGFLCKCNNLLRNGKNFTEDDIKILNSIKHFTLLEDFRRQSSPKNISVRIIAEIKRMSVDVVRSFFATLYRDLFDDIVQNGNYEICGNKYCRNIFQPVKRKPNDYNSMCYCSEPCDYRANRHKQYANDPQKYIIESRKDRNPEKDKEAQKNEYKEYFQDKKPQSKQSEQEGADDAPNWGLGI